MDYSLSGFVFGVLAGSMLLVTFFTLLSRVSRNGVERRSVRSRVICRLCLHAFEDHGSSRMPECPHCGALNERGRDRRLG